MKNKQLLATLMVGVGAIFYGVPASLYKMATTHGIFNGDMVIWIYLIATLFLTILGIFIEKKEKVTVAKKDKIQLFLAGIPVALTSILYVLALKYTSVTVVAVMLMQSVWLAILIGAVLSKTWPSLVQVLGVFFILGGTVVAAGLFPLKEALSLPGILLALGGALSYALMIHLTGDLGNHLPPVTKARYMSAGSFLLILPFWVPQVKSVEGFMAALPWGIVGSIFSMIVPLLAYAYFMPKLPLGMGPILSALELPFSMIFAFILLQEKIRGTQIVGVIVILTSIICVNLLEARQLDFSFKKINLLPKKPRRKRI